MGNHDAAVIGWRDTDDMLGSAREGTERHRRELRQDDLDWLRSLPYVYENVGFAVAHEEDRDCRVVVETCGTKEAAESDKPKLLFRLSRDVTYIGPVEAPKGTH